MNRVALFDVYCNHRGGIFLHFQTPAVKKIVEFTKFSSVEVHKRVQDSRGFDFNALNFMLMGIGNFRQV